VLKNYADYPSISYRVREKSDRFNLFDQNVYVDFLSAIQIIKIDEQYRPLSFYTNLSSFKKRFISSMKIFDKFSKKLSNTFYLIHKYLFIQVFLDNVIFIELHIYLGAAILGLAVDYIAHGLNQVQLVR
jgi:hypothetical protein